MEMMIKSSQNPADLQNQKPSDMRALVNQVGKFSQKLQSQGMPQKLINIGVAKGNPDKIELIFRKYVPFSPVEENS
jgi:hypothetical protein